MNRLITLSIVVALLPAVSSAHWITELDIETPEPIIVAQGETIDVIFNYTTYDGGAQRQTAWCPWRVRLDSLNPFDGLLLDYDGNGDDDLNWHYSTDDVEKTFNVVSSATIPSDTTIGDHSIVVYAGTDPLWSWPANELIIKKYVIPIDVISPVITVEIDIKPGSTPNTINLGSNGVVPVAILSSADFDALTVDPTTVQLEGKAGVRVKGNGSPLVIERDVNGDGYVDLEVKIEAENLEPGDIQDGIAEVTGNLLEEFGGTPIIGTDEITIVPPA